VGSGFTLSSGARAGRGGSLLGGRRPNRRGRAGCARRELAAPQVREAAGDVTERSLGWSSRAETLDQSAGVPAILRFLREHFREDAADGRRARRGFEFGEGVGDRCGRACALRKQIGVAISGTTYGGAARMSGLKQKTGRARAPGKSSDAWRTTCSPPLLRRGRTSRVPTNHALRAGAVPRRFTRRRRSGGNSPRGSVRGGPRFGEPGSRGSSTFRGLHVAVGRKRFS